MGGFISLHRDIRKHWIADNPKYFYWWVDLLMEANYKDKKILIDSKPFTVKRGSFLTSKRKLAQRWNCSRTTAERFLEALEGDGMISVMCTTHYTTITIENYAFYQGDSATSDTTDSATSDTTDDTQHNKDNKDNKYNKEIRYIEPLQAEGYLASWNRLTAGSGLARISVINEGTQRYNNLAKCIKQHGSDSFETAVMRVIASPFLCGQGKDGWKASFDWLVKPDNYQKVLDGVYRSEKKEAEQVQTNNPFLKMLWDRQKEGENGYQ